MTKTVMTALAMTALTILTGCDYAQRRELKTERGEASYQKAMAAYQAGQIDVAVKGFEKVVASDPANASARFQLACLLMDAKKDYLGALCNFREYRLLAPSSDKAEIAGKRQLLCEKSLATELAEKYELVDGAALARQTEEAVKARQDADRKAEDLAKALDETRGRIRTLEQENARLRKMISSVGDEPESAGRMSVADARRILDEEDEGDRLRLSPDAKALFRDAEDGDSRPDSAGTDDGGDDRRSSLIADHTSGRPAQTRLTETGRKPQSAAEEPPHAERPETYTVEDGDTLYKLAVRFYGRRSAWKEIREANKALISTDGRIRTGQVLRLP